MQRGKQTRLARCGGTELTAESDRIRRRNALPQVCELPLDRGKVDRAVDRSLRSAIGRQSYANNFVFVSCKWTLFTSSLFGGKVIFFAL
jgi:hypothetical protein